MKKLLALKVFADMFDFYGAGGQIQNLDPDKVSIAGAKYEHLLVADVPDPTCPDKHIAFAGDKLTPAALAQAPSFEFVLRLKYLENLLFAQVSKTQLSDLQASCCLKGAAPKVSLALNDNTVAPGVNVTLTATPTVGDAAISKIEFYDFDTLLGSDSDATGGYTFTKNWATAGTYWVAARAIDASGVVGWSTWIKVNVDPANV